MIQQVNFSIDIMENGKWRIENERKDYVILNERKSLAIIITVGAMWSPTHPLNHSAGGQMASLRD